MSTRLYDSKNIFNNLKCRKNKYSKRIKCY